MQVLDYFDYLALREGATVLEADGSGDKVLRLTNGSILKLFRRKRFISSAAWKPYAQRFADNCKSLHEKSVPCPHVRNVYRINEISRDAIHYDPLPGLTIRELISNLTAGDELREKLGCFIAELHEKGIYFRSAHLGNIILTPSSELGIIDIADMKIQRKPLSRSTRLRNFKHIIRYKKDKDWLFNSTEKTFANAYLKNQKICTLDDINKTLSALLKTQQIG